MKNTNNKILTLSILALIGASFSINDKAKQTDALTISKDVLAYNEMVGRSSAIKGNDLTPDNCDNQLTTYGFYHGSVASGNIAHFDKDNVSTNSLRSSSGTEFSNWRMTAAPNDNLIIKFSANKKFVFSSLREKLGADYREDTTLTVYKNSTPVYTHNFNRDNDKPTDYSCTVIGETTDVIYWELSTTASSARHISMDSAGVDWSTLPVFTIQEYTEESVNVSSFSNLIEAYTTSKTSVRSSDNLYCYEFYKGSRSGSTISTISNIDADTDKLTDIDLEVNKESIKVSNGQTVGLKITALADSVISVSYPEAGITHENNLYLAGYFYNNSISKTKLYYETTINNSFDKNHVSGDFILHTGDILFMEYKGTSAGQSQTNIVPTITSKMLINGYNDFTLFPKYTPTNYSTNTSITHKELTFESARVNCNPIELKDIKIAMVNGKVNETDGADVYPFSESTYDDGVYLEGNVTPKVLLTNKQNTFDGNGFAAAEDYRIKTSSANSLVYQIEAKTNTYLKISHPATTGGWIDDTDIHFATYYTIKNKLRQVIKQVVTSANNPADTFAQELYLKEGDKVYFVFATSIANERNLNITPVFTTDTSKYSEQGRDALIGPIVTSTNSFDSIPDFINNELNPINYDDNLAINFGHGDYKNPERLNSGIYDDGSEILFAGDNINANMATFWKWQVKGGVSGDDAIIVFTAEKDIYLEITHPIFPNEEAWATSSSVKYFINNGEGICAFLSEKYIEADAEASRYGYKAHLRAGESLVFDYSSNDESNYGVFRFEWTATANPATFNSELAYDFTDAIALQNLKDSLLQSLQNYLNSLDKNDYSVNNYALLENYVKDFEKDIVKMTETSEVQALYDETLAKMEAVSTLSQEQQIIQAAREEGIAEVQAYYDENIDNIVPEYKDRAARLLSTTITNISNLESQTLIRNTVREFKNAIDEMPRIQRGCKGSVIACSLLISSLSLVGVCLLKKNKDK